VIDCGIAILGGGEATRFPGKLEALAGDVPLIVRVYRNLGTERTTYVSCAATFPTAIDEMLPVPMVVDRMPRRGPLGGLFTTICSMPSRFVFAAAGDAPLVDESLVLRLLAAYEPGDEAVVPRHHETQIEPLAALYERSAFVRVATDVLRDGDGSLRSVIDGLRTRYVTIPDADARLFTNVNTPADYDRLTRELETA
jgi:molybdopterin-guanine dinucleotide biosynthesis protein A